VANINISRKSGFIRRAGVMKRDTLWISTGVIGAVPAAASTAILLTNFAGGILGLRPFTVVRTRGLLSARSDQLAAAEEWSIRYGHAVVSDQAVAIGVTAIPTPDTDSSSDAWFVFEELYGFLSDNVGMIGRTNVQFDSKAMRKVEDGFDSVSVVESSSASNGVNVKVGFRQLIKLH